MGWLVRATVGLEAWKEMGCLTLYRGLRDRLLLRDGGTKVFCFRYFQTTGLSHTKFGYMYLVNHVINRELYWGYMRNIEV